MLKQLRSAARIVAGEPVKREEELEDDRRILIDHIMEKFMANAASSIAIIIKKSFHTSLRNAFAHSEYDIKPQIQEIL